MAAAAIRTEIGIGGANLRHWCVATLPVCAPAMPCPVHHSRCPAHRPSRTGALGRHRYRRTPAGGRPLWPGSPPPAQVRAAVCANVPTHAHRHVLCRCSTLSNGRACTCAPRTSGTPSKSSMDTTVRSASLRRLHIHSVMPKPDLRTQGSQQSARARKQAATADGASGPASLSVQAGCWLPS